MLFQARHCAACGLRFPVQAQSPLGARCPECGAPTEFDGEPYESHDVQPLGIGEDLGPAIEVLIDNVRSVRNVGSMFRTADGAGIRCLHLCGFTPTPQHPKMAKTALGAERAVAWTHHPNSLEAASELVDRGHALWALEGGANTTSLFERARALSPQRAQPLVLVLGHEVSGVDPRILRLCEDVVSIPMAGVKGSLNVGVALGVAVYVLRHAWRLRTPASNQP